VRESARDSSGGQEPSQVQQRCARVGEQRRAIVEAAENREDPRPEALARTSWNRTDTALSDRPLRRYVRESDSAGATRGMTCYARLWMAIQPAAVDCRTSALHFS